MSDTDTHTRFTRRDGPRDRSLRAADADREAVADILREQHLAGRVDTDELQQRIERCYAARTYADLDALVADLPGDEARAAAGTTRRPWRLPILPLVALVIVAGLLSHGHLFWLAIPVFFFVVRPMLWRHAGAGWFGGGGFGCGARPSTHV